MLKEYIQCLTFQLLAREPAGVWYLTKPNHYHLPRVSVGNLGVSLLVKCGTKVTPREVVQCLTVHSVTVISLSFALSSSLSLLVLSPMLEDGAITVRREKRWCTNHTVTNWSLQGMLWVPGWYAETVGHSYTSTRRQFSRYDNHLKKYHGFMIDTIVGISGLLDAWL